MATLHMTEAEVARDLHGVLDKVAQGIDVAIERDHRVVAVIQPPPSTGRKISESIALAKAREQERGRSPVPDADFARDVQAAVDSHREPLNPPQWE